MDWLSHLVHAAYQPAGIYLDWSTQPSLKRGALFMVWVGGLIVILAVIGFVATLRWIVRLGRSGGQSGEANEFGSDRFKP